MAVLDQSTEDAIRGADRWARQSWAVVIGAAIATTTLVTLLDQWLLGGLLIGGLVLMLVIENVRRSWNFGSSMRFGIALGLLGAWAVWKFV